MPETDISNSDSEFARIQPTEFSLYSLPNHDLNRQEKFTVLIGKQFTMLEPHAGRDRETRLDMRDHGRRLIWATFRCRNADQNPWVQSYERLIFIQGQQGPN